MTQNTLSDEIKREETDFVEKGAALEHERWAKWQRYLHAKCFTSEDGDLIIPKELVEHWERQIATPYSELSETEKESDRKQVREYLPLLDKICRSIAEKTVEAVSIHNKYKGDGLFTKRADVYQMAVEDQNKLSSAWLGKEN